MGIAIRLIRAIEQQKISGRRIAVSLCALAILLCAQVACKAPAPPARTAKHADSTAIVPYHTIAAGPDADTLYAYELHRRKTPQSDAMELCALIKNIDPAADDYKAYCKAVIADIVKGTGNDKSIIYIYDSNEAYQLYEVKYLQQLHNLEAAESSLVGRHLVATYTGKQQWDYDESDNLIYYYADARNGLAEREHFDPAKD